MSEALEKENWYSSLIDDCKSIVVESSFNSRWFLIQGYHALGTRIVQDFENFERKEIYGKNIIAHVAESIGKSPSTIWRAVQFAKKYPDLNKLPEGKDSSWHQICNKYLSEGNDKEVKETTKMKEIKCPLCNENFTIDLLKIK